MAFKTGNSTNKISLRGNKKERRLFTEVSSHYDMAREDLDSRLDDFDTKDELFRTHIDESDWPYNSLVFDPRVFTFITEKTSRLFANKPRGRLVPREGGDTLGARINNQLLQYQWDEDEKVDNMPMIAKWAMMDQNTRKYGASFALAKWHYKRKPTKNGDEEAKNEVWFDGPDFKPLVNRDCLPNPSYSSIKNWFQHREYVTLQELQNTNDAARSKPIYKNLDLLRQAIKEGEDQSKYGGDKRETNWQSKNKSIKNLDDYLGRDEYFRTIEIVTEYREDRWITFAPKHGVVLRDIPNPYDHGRIPVVMLRYYIVDDDLYGLSEIEPIERLQKATNALVCQYVDTINMSLYAPLKIRANAVQMHTLEFGPGKKWIMNNPDDVTAHDMTPTGVTEFTSTYRFLVSAMQNALGEASAALSNIVPGKEGKTATEVKDAAMQRNARDNFNQIFLSEALKKQMMFWHMMNRQFLFNEQDGQSKVIRIVGKDALRYFQKLGLDKRSITDEAGELLSDPDVMEYLNETGEDLRDYATPIYPVETEEGIKPKLQMDGSNASGKLHIEQEDMAGLYDYIPDVESMQLPDDRQITEAKQQILGMALSPEVQKMIASEGYSIKIKELLEDFFEDLGQKDADKYFEKLENVQQQPVGQMQMPGQPGAQQPGMGQPQAGRQQQPMGAGMAQKIKGGMGG